MLCGVPEDHPYYRGSTIAAQSEVVGLFVKVPGAVVLEEGW